ncbi:MAG: hypothetical protein AABM42_05145 [Actinomycetota bacterium]
MERLTALIAVIVVSCVPFAACGSDNGGSSPVAHASAADKAKFLDCLKRGKIRVVPSGKVDVTVEGRVPRVSVPAEYLGAAVLPSRGFFDLWLARDSASAAAAAEELNEAVSQKLGSEAQVADARGLVVSAIGGNVQVDVPSEVVPLLRCPDRL